MKLDACDKKIPSELKFLTKIHTSKICCCTAPVCEKSKSSCCDCNIIGQTEYIVGEAFILNALGEQEQVAIWYSTQTVIDDKEDYVVLNIEDIWRFNKDDSLYTKYQAIQFKKTNKVEYFVGWAGMGTGKYLGHEGTIKTSLTSDGFVYREVIFYK